MIKKDSAAVYNGRKENQCSRGEDEENKIRILPHWPIKKRKIFMLRIDNFTH